MHDVMWESCAAQGCGSRGGWGAGGTCHGASILPGWESRRVAAPFIPAREHDLDVPMLESRVAFQRQFWLSLCRAEKHGLQAWQKEPADLPSPPFSHAPSPPMLRHVGTARLELVMAVTI